MGDSGSPPTPGKVTSLLSCCRTSNDLKMQLVIHRDCGKLVRIYCSETDKWQDQPLYEAIIERCRDLGIAGATVYRGLEGFGMGAEIHKLRIRPLLYEPTYRDGSLYGQEDRERIEFG